MIQFKPVCFQDMEERLMDVISHDLPDEQIKEKHVADALEINPNTYYSKKSREQIPFVEIISFCYRRRVNPSWVLFEYGPRWINAS